MGGDAVDLLAPLPIHRRVAFLVPQLVSGDVAFIVSSLYLHRVGSQFLAVRPQHLRCPGHVL